MAPGMAAWRASAWQIGTEMPDVPVSMMAVVKESEDQLVRLMFDFIPFPTPYDIGNGEEEEKEEQKET